MVGDTNGDLLLVGFGLGRILLDFENYALVGFWFLGFFSLNNHGVGSMIFWMLWIYCFECVEICGTHTENGTIFLGCQCLQTIGNY